MKILMLSHTADFGAFKVGSHHLSREFSKMGHEVIHVSTPLSVPQLASRRAPHNRLMLARSGPIRDEFGVVHSTGVVPIPLRAAGQRRLVTHILSRAEANDADLVFLDEPLMAPVIRAKHAGIVVYRPTDVYSTGVRARRQARVLGKVDAVVATSGPVLEALTLPSSVPAAVVENGVEYDRFSAMATTERRGVVYVGALDERFDWATLQVMAEAVPGVDIDLYGPVHRPPPMPGNVRLRGPIPYYEVARVLAEARVGLLPFTSTVLNGGRSPMKFYEYLAAGLNVVGSETPVLRARVAPGTLLYHDRRGAANALRAALLLPSPNLSGRDNAASHAWGAKAVEILNFAAAIEKRSGVEAG